MPISATDLNKAYLAYFGRPADLTGKTYFATLEQADVIKAFDASAESQALYGTDVAAKVNAIYMNLFNREAEPEGLTYWTTLITQGRVTAAEAALSILNGAQGTDATSVSNKLAAAEAFVAAMDTTSELVGYSGMDAAASARNWLKAVDSDAATLTAAVAGAQAAVTAAVAAGSGEGGAGYQLTNGTDVASSNVFTAGLVYTPGGDDRVNSLQDEDRLTGTGTNATLNATLGNANDNGATMVTPTLTNINTINVAFTGSGNATNTLDLQDATGVDAVNITRISTGFGAIVQNITTAASQLSISNSNSPLGNGVGLTFLGSAVAGTADSTTLTLKNVNVSGIRVQQHAAAATPVNNGFETINLVSTGSTNTVGVLLAEDLQTLNISGTQNLNLGTLGATLQGQSAEAVRYGDVFRNADGSLSKIDASTFEGKLDLTLGSVFNAGADNTSGVNVKFDLTGGKGDDTIRLTQGTVVGGTAATRDNINGGEGNNTLVLLGSSNIIQAGTAAAPVANVTNIQALEVRSGHDDEAGVTADVITVDADAFDKLATIYVRNEGQNDTVVGVADGVFNSAAEGMTVNLNNLTSAQANAITVAHGTTGNSNILNNTVNATLKTAAGTADLVSLTIVDGINTNPRFNAILGTQNAAGATGAVESITLIDSDTESNTIALASVAQHTGTVTVKGGVAGTFTNLDTTTAGANGGLYQYDVTGAVDAALSNAALGRIADQSGTANQVRLTAGVVNAADALSDVIVRVSSSPTSVSLVGAQAITMGAGNDTVIFDNLGDTRAGLSISDTVVGGEGNDTLAIDGNVAITLGASEWTNVSGFETIRLVGNGVLANNAAGATNSYNLTLTNNLLATNKDANGFLNILSDNDAFNNVGRTAAVAALVPGGNDAALSSGGVTIDARGLSAGSKWSFKGNEGAGAGASADRLIMADANIDGNAVIDGGAVDNVTNNRGIGSTDGTTVVGNVTVANRGNADVIEVRNAAVVSQGDLANVKNIGTLSFTNDTAVAIGSTLQLNDSIVDNMVDSYQASVSRAAAATATTGGANVEVLVINAVDNVNVAAATTGMTIEAGTLTDKSDLSITLGRGANNVVTGAGQDRVVLLGNYAAGTYAVNENGVAINAQSTASIAARVVNDTINLGTGNDTLVTYGAINLAGAVLTGVEVLVANSDVTLTQDQYNALTTIRFDGAANHTLTIINSAGGLPIDLSKIVDNTGGTITVTNNALEGSIGVPPAGVIVMGAVVDVAGAALLPAGSYSLNDTAVNLAGAAAGIRNGAIDITANTAATVAQANTIDAATNTGVNTYSVTDSAANLLGTPLAGVATAVTVTGNAAGALTEAQHGTLTGITTDDTWTFSITDSAANLLDGTIAGATAVTVTGNAAGALTEAQHGTLAGITTDDTWTFSITDSAANLLNGTIAGATAVTVTGNAAGALTEAEHGTLTGITSDDTWTFSITDSAANLLDGTIAGATAVTVTGNAAGELAQVADYATLTAVTTDDTFSYSLTDVSGAAFAGAALATITGATSNKVVLLDEEIGLVINGLGTGDTLNVAADNTVALATVVALAADVDANGEWNFSAGVLTWYDGAATHSIGLVGVTNVVLGASDVFTLIG